MMQQIEFHGIKYSHMICLSKKNQGMESRIVCKLQNKTLKISFKCQLKWIKFISRIRKLLNRYRLLIQTIVWRNKARINLRLRKVKIKIFINQSLESMNRHKPRKMSLEILKIGSYSKEIKLCFWIIFPSKFIIVLPPKNYKFLWVKHKFISLYCLNGSAWLPINHILD